jgi:predicted nucleic acid-binding protein
MTCTAGIPVVVVDASAAMAFLAGEPDWVERVRRWVEADAMLLVPAHFGVEVANALVRDTRSTAGEAAARVERLLQVGFETADRGLPGLLGGIELADRHRLTVYDSVYLDLALDVDAELATLDLDLAAAATAEGVPLAESEAGSR